MPFTAKNINECYAAQYVGGAAVPMNDDECIAARDGWGTDYNCQNSLEWCEDDYWGKDV